jgi:hypothetical protein
MSSDDRQLNLAVSTTNAGCRIAGVVQRCWLHVSIDLGGGPGSTWMYILELPAQEEPVYNSIFLDTTPIQLRYNQLFMVTVYPAMTYNGNTYRSGQSYARREWALRAPGMAQFGLIFPNCTSCRCALLSPAALCAGIYLGCFQLPDLPVPAPFEVLLNNDAAMSVDKCVALARSKFFAYAALRSGSSCTAGNGTLYELYAGLLPEDMCGALLQCPGDSLQTCGSAGADEVYSTLAATGVCLFLYFQYWSANETDLNMQLSCDAAEGSHAGACVLPDVLQPTSDEQCACTDLGKRDLGSRKNMYLPETVYGIVCLIRRLAALYYGSNHPPAGYTRFVMEVHASNRAGVVAYLMLQNELRYDAVNNIRYLSLIPYEIGANLLQDDNVLDTAETGLWITIPFQRVASVPMFIHVPGGPSNEIVLPPHHMTQLMSPPPPTETPGRNVLGYVTMQLTGCTFAFAVSPIDPNIIYTAHFFHSSDTGIMPVQGADGIVGGANQRDAIRNHARVDGLPATDASGRRVMRVVQHREGRRPTNSQPLDSEGNFFYYDGETVSLYVWFNPGRGGYDLVIMANEQIGFSARHTALELLSSAVAGRPIAAVTIHLN